MAVQGAPLHTDTNGVDTSARYMDRGDGTPEWLLFSRLADGADAAQGSKADTAVTDPTAAASLIALVKGLLTATHAEDAASASGALGMLALAIRNSTLAASTSADGDYSAIAAGAAGEVFATATASAAIPATAPDNATSTVYATSLVVKAGAGVLFGIIGYNSKASAQFVLVHDAATLPADGAAPKIVLTVPATSNFSIDFGPFGRKFSTGIVLSNSSTGPTKTVGAADCWFDAQYK